MTVTPPPGVIEAVLGESTEITRRVEIYESDGYTLWHESAPVVDGEVTVSATQGRADRRGLSCTLRNQDGDLDNYPGGFWYDKIIRPYRGVAFWDDFTGRVAVESHNPLLWYRFSTPSGSLIEDSGTAMVTGTASGSVTPENAGAFVGDPSGAMFFNGGRIILDPSKTDSVDMRRKFSISFWFKTSNEDEQAVYTAYDYADTGNGIWIRINQNDIAGRFAVSDGAAIHTADNSSVLDGQWHHFVVAQGTLRTTMYLDGVIASTSTSPAHPRNARFHEESQIGNHPTVSMPFMGSLDEFAIFDGELTASDVAAMYRAGRGVVVRRRQSWECSLGDFMVDDIQTKHHPSQVYVSGRDLMKKLMLSKFKYATAFEKGMPIEELIEVVARNGGIDKFTLPSTGRVTGKEFYFDRGVERAQAVYDIATAYGYEIYINSEGYLTIEETPDPVLSPSLFTFKTGQDGTVTNFEKKTRDARIYNVVVVTGESTGDLPVYAIAENREPTSPTRIAEPGVPGGLSERVYQYTSAFITTVEQAQATADSFLKVHALEEFEVSIGSTVIPWLEAGRVINFIDPKPNPGDPVKFLMKEFTVPLTLDPMNITAKRVTLVG